jgi:hypothetical protein
MALLGLVAIASTWAGNPVGATLTSRAATGGPSAASPGRPHLLPALGAAAQGQACATSCAPVTFHAGGVVQHGESVYFIFWLPSSPSGLYFPPAYGPTLSTWLADAAAANFTSGNVFSVAQQYYDLTGPGATRNFVQYALTPAPARVVTDPLPASSCTDNVPGSGALPYCLTDAQVQAELLRTITAGNLPQTTNASYVLFTPYRVGSCLTTSGTSCGYTNYCGYHSFFAGTQGTIVYSTMPWLYGMHGCDPQLSSGMGYANGSPADPEASMVSHELIEMMTDPRLNAWYDSTGHEIGEKCAFDYGSGGVGSTTGLYNNGLGYWNQGLNGDEYLLQLEFSNRNSNGTSTGCVGNDTDPQPVVKLAVSPNPPVHGAITRFTATVTDPAGLYRIHWAFGDGSSAYNNPVQHQYATAGPETISILVTDQHGNERLTRFTVNVS